MSASSTTIKGIPPNLASIEEPSQVSEKNKLYSAGDVRLLVVDDDPGVCRLVQAAFSKHEFEVDSVSVPGQIENCLRTNNYQLIILDYCLEPLEPKQVMDWIQETQKEVSVIVVTAYPSMDSVLHCLRSHTYDYITKPFNIEHLQRTVIRCLEGRGLLRLSEEALREQLGASIRERRKALGLTLAEMAKRTSVSLGYLSQIELGKNSASIETLYRIALGLRMRVADLFHTVQAHV